MPAEATHWVPTRFRTLTAEDIGKIQHRIWDLQHRAVEVAADYKISSATLYRVKNAVPVELIEFDEVQLKKWRQRERKAKKRAKLTRVA